MVGAVKVPLTEEIYPLEENKQLDYAAFLSLKKSAIIKIDT